MEFDWNVLLIVLPFIFVGGFVDSIAGGGGVVNVIGFMLSGMPMHMILGTNKVQALFGTSVATYNYVSKGHYKKDFIIFSLIGAAVGSLIGAYVASMTDQDTLRWLMTIILPVAALIMVSGIKPKKSLLDESRKKIFIITLLIGLGIGFYDGMLGPGTGTFLIIAFSMCGLSILDANGNAKVVNLASNLMAGALFLIKGKVIIWLVIPCIITNVIANYIGSKLAIKNGEKIVKPIIVAVLVLLFIKTIADIL
ncbi:putative membrane protein YfcA [Bacilli bacterium PM5-3]|nr:putative membrane protein YfcA [Bacilli bacterium PM5-3]MDH6604263.1 putative membrane protein YfcA [Bacilli bacterium PM5-9]